MQRKKEDASTVIEGRLSYKTLENHQQNVYNLDDVVQKAFFSVAFHNPLYKKGLLDFISSSNMCQTVSQGVEINSKGELLTDTHCTYCHSSIKYVQKSFLDVQLWRKVASEHVKAHTDYQNWLLSYDDSNPWAAAVTQLVILRCDKTNIPEAIIFPTVENCPDRALVSNLMIALRQCTEDSRFAEHYQKNMEKGLSRRAASLFPPRALSNSNHSPFSYQTVDCNVYQNHPSFALTQIGWKFTGVCNKHCWGNDETPANEVSLAELRKEKKWQ